jgi:methanethiol S-methyltransferase
MSRRAYGAVAYLVFAGVFVYTAGFLAGVGVPKGIDDGTDGPAWIAVLVDGGLLGLFAVQHSVMARPWFKGWWTRRIPPAIERSTYVLAASLVVILLLWQWRPLPDQVWSVGAGWARGLLWIVYGLGWVLLLGSTFAIGHLEMFGLREEVPGFRQPLLYRLVRHPIMVGFFIVFWAAPDMSVGRLLFAGLGSGYILVAVRFEEHDLGKQLGEPYRRYMAETPRFVPRLRRGGEEECEPGTRTPKASSSTAA